MRYVNVTHQLVILRLNSGGAIHLAPGEVSRPLPPSELQDNPHLAKLLRLNAIAREPAQA